MPRGFLSDRMGQGLAVIAIAALVIGAAVVLTLLRARRARAAKPPRPLPPREPVPPPAPDDTYLACAENAGLDTGEAFRDAINAVAARSKLPVLGVADIDRLAALIDRRSQLRASFRRTPPIALVRQKRQGIDITSAGTSWLGGAPALGPLAWPRGPHGRPLHHLAPIDLTYLPAGLVPETMPRDGSLCFFMGTDHTARQAHRVIHVPAGHTDPTPLPADLPILFDGPDWGLHITGHLPADAPKTFARWPLSFYALPMPDPDDTTAAAQAMAHSFGTDHGAVLRVTRYAKTAPHLARPWLWDSAQRVVNSLLLAEEELPATISAARARVATHGARYAPELDFMIANETAFRRYVQAAAQWVAGRDPYTPMAAEDIALLEAMFVQIKTPQNRLPSFALFYRYSRGHMNGLRDALNATLLALAAEKQSAFSLLPAVVQTDLDSRQRLPAPGCWHQMFGLGADPATTEAGTHLLLQLRADRLVGMDWADGGLLSFTIGTDDLAAQRWDGTMLTLARP
jgi:hypothetical protein